MYNLCNYITILSDKKICLYLFTDTRNGNIENAGWEDVEGMSRRRRQSPGRLDQLKHKTTFWIFYVKRKNYEKNSTFYYILYTKHAVNNIDYLMFE